MFKTLTDLGMKRTGKQALGFYLAYLLLFMVVGGLLGGVAGLSGVNSGSGGFDTGMRLGVTVSVILSLGLSILILRAKKKQNSFGLILIALLSGLLAILGGGLLGLIPVAFLTTK